MVFENFPSSFKYKDTSKLRSIRSVLAHALLCPVVPDIRKSIALFEGYEASASYPSNSSNVMIMMNMELGGETSRKESPRRPRRRWETGD